MSIEVDKPLVSLRRLAQLLGRSPRDIQNMAEHAGRYYRPFDLRRAGTLKWRHIDNPTDELRYLQTRIYRALLKHHPLPGDLHGGVPGKSIRSNATGHIRSRQLVTLDLHSCFPRIDHRAVYSVFAHDLNCSPTISSILTKLTTFQTRLPQGAPTSPMVANLTLVPLYREILEVCKERGLTLTFFVDDIAISGDRAFDVVAPVLTIIRRHGHSVRGRKLHRMRSSDPQRLTGLTLNRYISVGRKRLREIANAIYTLADQADPSSADLLRVRGLITFVTTVQPIQGRHLRELERRLLPVVGRAGTARIAKASRECHAARRHRND